MDTEPGTIQEPGSSASTPAPESHTNTGDSKITPAQVNLSSKAVSKTSTNLLSQTGSQAAAAENSAHSPWWLHNRAQMFGFLCLITLLLAVVFWLPNAVEPPPPPAASTQPAPVMVAKPIESPFQEAQLAKQRQEAQEVLSKILDLQTKLEKMSVNLWAAETFNKGMDTAAAGDKSYRQRKFAEAQTQYQTTLKIFEQLVIQSEETFSEALERGIAAIEAGDSEVALKQLTLALAIRPDNEEAQVEIARAQVLKQVLALVNDGQNLEKQKQFEAAQKQYEQALQLDPNSKLVTEKVAAVKQAITDRDFSKAMSKGYAALQSNAYTSAKKAFRNAIALKPDASEATTALTQTENQHTQIQINQLLETARQKEKKEAWAAAKSAYQKALDLDKSVVNARIGLIRTSTRDDFDTAIESILKDQLRLADETVYQQAQQLHTEAKAITNPGPRLQKQIQRLERALQLAVAPVTVHLKSDNQTDVTLYKVGNLGNFVKREMTLKPGHYTAVGIREGYRDVRREFSISPGSDIKTIVIQCVEKIALDG